MSALGDVAANSYNVCVHKLMWLGRLSAVQLTDLRAGWQAFMWVCIGWLSSPRALYADHRPTDRQRHHCPLIIVLLAWYYIVTV